MSQFDLLSRIRYRMWVANQDLHGAAGGAAGGIAKWQKQVVIALVLVGVALGARYYFGGEASRPSQLPEMVVGKVAPKVAVKPVPATTQAPMADNTAGGEGEPQPKEAAAAVPVPAPKAAGGDVADRSALVKTASTGATDKESALGHALKHADPTYVCPMHPDVQSKDPGGTCPICGMDLVLVEAGGEADVVSISSNVINMLGVRTDVVKKRNLYRKIDTVGYVTYDENRVRDVSLRTEGWLERMAVKAEGDRVEKGQLLFELYSPKLVNAQEEYLQALVTRNESLVSASKERMVSLGVSGSQIKRLEQTHIAEQYVKVYAPQSGIVQTVHMREGSFVPPSKPVITLSDISKVWLVANVFERQADWVQVNNRATASLPFYPEKSWEGMVDFIYPSLDKKTRSLQVRLLFDNVEERLKPNMYADVQVYAKPKKKTLAIPREALIRTGNNDRVIVALGEGRFKPVSVNTGIETDSHVEILAGLQEGEEVVVSSQFLIDSESSLRASLMRMGAK